MLNFNQSALKLLKRNTQKMIAVPTREMVDSICLSMRHDFGLMSENEKNMMRIECRAWWGAIWKELSYDRPDSR